MWVRFSIRVAVIGPLKLHMSHEREITTIVQRTALIMYAMSSSQRPNVIG